RFGSNLEKEALLVVAGADAGRVKLLNAGQGLLELGHRNGAVQSAGDLLERRGQIAALVDMRDQITEHLDFFGPGIDKSELIVEKILKRLRPASRVDHRIVLFVRLVVNPIAGKTLFLIEMIGP